MFFRNRLLTGVVMLAAVSAPAVALAEDGPWLVEGDWLVRLGVHQLNPDKSNLPGVDLPGSAPSGDLVLDKAEALSLDAEYMFTEHLGVDLFVPTYFSLDVQLRRSSLGEVAKIGETDLWTPIVGLNWHFNPDGAIRPYLGVGAAWANFTGEEIFAPGVPANTRLDIDEVFGPAGRAGVDIGTSEHWFLNLDVRYLWLDADVDTIVPTGISTTTVPLGEATIDPWLYGIAVGYRFGAPKPLPEPVAEEPPPPPPPPPPPEKCADGDNDGVCDADDKCPGTPAGARVDRVGCPLSQTLKLLFDFDSAELRPESITELERLVSFMNNVPFATALIEGHTDSVGADAYNLALSDRRAKSVFDYLTSRGVDPARVKSVGKGETEPVADNSTEEGRQENRRVLLIRTDTGT
jgi:outer membrane protein W/outer membrane protein OmpA-like peptidoglycan-associated protein